MSEKISVLMPVYNRENLVGDAVKSIVMQTHENLELIIFDDGSRDKTADVVEAFMRQDERIRLIKGEKNNGVAYARNVLLDAVATKYTCWQDSDDMSNIHRLERQLGFALSMEISLVYSFYKIYRGIELPNIWRNAPQKDGERKKGFATVMFETDRNIRFNENMRLGGEDHGWLKKMEEKMGGFAWVQEVLYYIRFHEDRIGVWKRKLARISGFTGIDCSEKEQTQSYEEMIEAYKRVRA